MITRVAAAVFGLLILAVIAGFASTAPDTQRSGTYSAAAQSASPTEVNYTDAALTQDDSTSWTGMALLVLGAATIGQIFFRPRAVLRTDDHSSIAPPGAVFDTFIRNSKLFLDFFNRSISRSIA